MGIAAYNRGSRAIRAQIDREFSERRTRPVSTPAPRFWATIEFLLEQRAAIVELTNVTTGEWAGGGRITVACRPHFCGHNVRDSLYEIGYQDACLRAAAKGGTLDRFSEWEGA